MSDTMTATTDQWMMQFYDRQAPNDPQVLAMEGLISDANTIVTAMSSSSSPSPTSPKAMINGSKPIRRRSRASKRTPTTLLNANTTNFRALVQQFTGCPSNTAMSFEVYKGPITLNFQQGRRQVVHHNTTRTKAPFGNISYSGKVHQQQHHQHQQQQQELAAHHQQQWPQDHQQQQQQQQSGDDNNLFDYSTDFFPSPINSPSTMKPRMELSDGLIVDHNYSLNDLTMDSAFFSNDMIQNDSYFM